MKCAGILDVEDWLPAVILDLSLLRSAKLPKASVRISASPPKPRLESLILAFNVSSFRSRGGEAPSGQSGSLNFTWPRDVTMEVVLESPCTVGLPNSNVRVGLKFGGPRVLSFAYLVGQDGFRKFNKVYSRLKSDRSVM